MISDLFLGTDAAFGRASIVLAIAGATITVRGWLYKLACRERDAFELGRESVRAVR